MKFVENKLELKHIKIERYYVRTIYSMGILI